MTDDDIDDMYLGLAARMFSRINGKPCVNIDTQSGTVYVCRNIHNLRVDEGVVEGVCDWLDADDLRPEELTDGLAISGALLDVGGDWWFDIYFGWYYVFSPDLVERSSKDDHAWVSDFLATTIRNRTVPRPPQRLPARSLQKVLRQSSFTDNEADAHEIHARRPTRGGPTDPAISKHID